MIFRWWRNRKRRKILAQPAPEGWLRLLSQRVPFYRELGETDRATLLDIARVIVAEKRWEPCGGLERIDEESKLLIAIQAALLLLRIDHEYYRRIHSILVYPSVVAAPSRRGDLHVQVGVAGQADPTGTIALALDIAEAGLSNGLDGRNVVIHEFAHALDFMDHCIDGTPSLDRSLFDRWVSVMTEHYEELCDDAQRSRSTLLNKYGATNPAEFFAVATEAFFEKGPMLARKHRELYDVLAAYYGQDTAAWRVRSP